MGIPDPAAGLPDRVPGLVDSGNLGVGRQSGRNHEIASTRDPAPSCGGRAGGVAPPDLQMRGEMIAYSFHMNRGSATTGLTIASNGPLYARSPQQTARK